VAYCALVFAALRLTAGVDDSVVRACLVTIDAVSLPWVALALVRPTVRPGPRRDQANQTLKWLPVGLTFGVTYFQEPLGLDPEFALGLPFCFCALFVPTMLFWPVLRPGRRDMGEL
jgi:hypothetical protein